MYTLVYTLVYISVYHTPMYILVYTSMDIWYIHRCIYIDIYTSEMYIPYTSVYIGIHHSIYQSMTRTHIYKSHISSSPCHLQPQPKQQRMKIMEAEVSKQTKHNAVKTTTTTIPLLPSKSPSPTA